MKRVFELKDAIQAFMEGKGHPIAEFNNPEWIQDFAFLVDVTTHLNKLNSQLQEKEQLIHSMFDHINTFVTKLALWETPIQNQNFIHFPTLKSLEVQHTQKYANLITELKKDFDHRFSDFENSAMRFKMLSCPFSVKIKEVPENLQMEFVDFQCSYDLKEKFNNFSLLEFYKKFVSKEKYQRIHTLAVYMSSLFDTTYLCEQDFSRMYYAKSSLASLTSDRHMENSLRIATSSLPASIT